MLILSNVHLDTIKRASWYYQPCVFILSTVHLDSINRASWFYQPCIL